MGLNDFVSTQLMAFDARMGSLGRKVKHKVVHTHNSREHTSTGVNESLDELVDEMNTVLKECKHWRENRPHHAKELAEDIGSSVNKIENILNELRVVCGFLSKPNVAGITVALESDAESSGSLNLRLLREHNKSLSRNSIQQSTIAHSKPSRRSGSHSSRNRFIEHTEKNHLMDEKREKRSLSRSSDHLRIDRSGKHKEKETIGSHRSRDVSHERVKRSGDMRSNRRQSRGRSLRRASHEHLEVKDVQPLNLEKENNMQVVCYDGISDGVPTDSLKDEPVSIPRKNRSREKARHRFQEPPTSSQYDDIEWEDLKPVRSSSRSSHHSYIDCSGNRIELVNSRHCASTQKPKRCEHRKYSVDTHIHRVESRTMLHRNREESHHRHHHHHHHHHSSHNIKNKQHHEDETDSLKPKEETTSIIKYNEIDDITECLNRIKSMHQLGPTTTTGKELRQQYHEYTERSMSSLSLEHIAIRDREKRDFFHEKDKRDVDHDKEKRNVDHDKEKCDVDQEKARRDRGRRERRSSSHSSRHRHHSRNHPESKSEMKINPCSKAQSVDDMAHCEKAKAFWDECRIRLKKKMDEDEQTDNKDVGKPTLVLDESLSLASYSPGEVIREKEHRHKKRTSRSSHRIKVEIARAQREEVKTPETLTLSSREDIQVFDFHVKNSHHKIPDTTLDIGETSETSCHLLKDLEKPSEISSSTKVGIDVVVAHAHCYPNNICGDNHTEDDTDQFPSLSEDKSADEDLPLERIGELMPLRVKLFRSHSLTSVEEATEPESCLEDNVKYNPYCNRINTKTEQAMIDCISKHTYEPINIGNADLSRKRSHEKDNDEQPSDIFTLVSSTLCASIRVPSPESKSEVNYQEKQTHEDKTQSFIHPNTAGPPDTDAATAEDKRKVPLRYETVVIGQKRTHDSIVKEEERTLKNYDLSAGDVYCGPESMPDKQWQEIGEEASKSHIHIVGNISSGEVAKFKLCQEMHSEHPTEDKTAIDHRTSTDQTTGTCQTTGTGHTSGIDHTTGADHTAGIDHRTGIDHTTGADHVTGTDYTTRINSRTGNDHKFSNTDTAVTDNVTGGSHTTGINDITVKEHTTGTNRIAGNDHATDCGHAADTHHSVCTDHATRNEETTDADQATGSNQATGLNQTENGQDIQNSWKDVLLNKSYDATVMMLADEIAKTLSLTAVEKASPGPKLSLHKDHGSSDPLISSSGEKEGTGPNQATRSWENVNVAWPKSSHNPEDVDQDTISISSNGLQSGTHSEDYSPRPKATRRREDKEGAPVLSCEQCRKEQHTCNNEGVNQDDSDMANQRWNWQSVCKGHRREHRSRIPRRKYYLNKGSLIYGKDNDRTP